MTQRTARSPGDLVVIALFALLLLAPAALALTGHAGFDVTFLQHTEQRNPFVAPPVTSGALATGGWERDVEREIADAFPLRKQLIQSYDYAKFAWLGDVRGDVIGGRDGWFFLAREERTYLTDSQHPTDATLARIADVAAARTAWCRRRGIRYIVVIAPNKSSIYPQYLPPRIVPVTPSPLDRLLPMLHARNVDVVDVRAELLAATRESGDPVYSKGDTHWNDAGAYIGYHAIVSALRDAGVHDTIVPSTIRVHTDPSAHGDLLALTGIADFVSNPLVRYDYPRRAREIAVPPDPQDPLLATFEIHATAVDDPSLPKLILFGDSFAAGLQPFLAEDFRRALFLRSLAGQSSFDEHLVAAEHPTVVIQERVERSLSLDVAQ